MRILYELSWLWKILGAALAAVALCLACAMLICKVQKKKLNKRVAAIIGTAAFVIAVLVVMIAARTPVLI